MVDIALFREGMRRLAGSVCIITTITDDGRTGCTATAVCSLSDSPPSLIICLNQNSITQQAIAESKSFCVNVTASRDIEVATRFAESGSGDSGFEVGAWTATSIGSPHLTSAVVAFDCDAGDIVKFGTHYVTIGLIKEVLLSKDSDNALLYAKGQYGMFLKNQNST